MEAKETQLSDSSIFGFRRELSIDEKNFQTIFDSAPIGIFIIDEEMKLLRTNLAFQSMLGFSDYELRGFNFSEFTHPDDIKKSIDHFKKLLSGKCDYYCIEKRYLRKDGNIVLARKTVSSLRDSFENIAYAIAMIQDITERKSVINELRYSQDKYRQVIENASEAIVVLQDGGFKFFNPKTIELTGYSVIELQSIPFINIIYPDDRNRALNIQKLILESKRERGDSTFSFRLLDKEGNIKWVEIQGVPIIWNEKPASLNFLTNVTIRKQTELALRESEERFRTIFESAPIGILITNKDMQPIQTNRAFQNMLGYTNNELTQTIFAEFTHPEDIEESENLFKGLVNRKYDCYRFEKRYFRKNNEIVWAYLVVTSVLDNEGELIYTIAMVEDITAKKISETALRKRESEMNIQAKYLEEANAALKVLLAKREKDKEQLEKNVLSNINQLILPHIERLKKIKMNSKQLILFKLLENNLLEIISPFAYKMSYIDYCLTPRELQIADFIRNGNTTKEVADFLNVSTKTVDFHRNNIRNKFGIKNKKLNLRSFLLNLK